MKYVIWVLSVCLCHLSSSAADLGISFLSRNGVLSVTNAYSKGVVTVQKAASLAGPWTAAQQTFSLSPEVQLNLHLSGSSTFFRSLAVDLTGTGGSWMFTTNDIPNLEPFAETLIAPSGSDDVSLYLMNQFSQDTLDLLSLYQGGPDAPLHQALVEELNLGLLSGPIYDAGVFAGVALSAPTQNLLTNSPQGTNLVILNRMLLEDAYPQYLVRKRALEFTNLVNSYGTLTTVAGAGGTPDSPNNKWLPESEDGPATNVYLSRPHIAMADRTGNIYIADKEAHAIRKVTPDGNIHTVAGNNSAGYGSTNPVQATTVSLNNPNGLWVFEDGSFYILDRDNGLIRRVATNGIMTLVVDNGVAIPEGRGLWVSSDESVLYYSAGTEVKRWDSTNGLVVHANGFSQLGNLAVSPAGQLVVTDRKYNQVYQINSDGTKTVIAGNGSTYSGGDGQLATETGLYQVRGIWFLPTGAYFLATDNGSQVWYVDTYGYIHLFLNGDFFSHDGDGAWFYDPATPKVSKIRQITMNYDGDLIITENDAGYVRKVRFLRHEP